MEDIGLTKCVESKRRAKDHRFVRSHENLGRQRARLLNTRHIRCIQKLLRYSVLQAWVRRGIVHRGALADGSLEGQLPWTLLASVGCNMVHDGPGACRFANHRDTASVAAKQVDVLLHPVQSEALVEQTDVGCAGLGE